MSVKARLGLVELNATVLPSSGSNYMSPSPTRCGKRGKTVVYSEGDTGLRGAGAVVSTTVGVAGVAAEVCGAADGHQGSSQSSVQFDPAARVVISTALRNR
jgi:hypothetical protein